MITRESPAKINWLLRVLSQRDDGYHEIETVFQEISIHDTIELEESSRFELTCDNPAVPCDESNLVWKAWDLLQRRWGIPPVSIRLTKKIPIQGGLGGGSSNAATMLRALTEMFSVEIDESELSAAALELGSDVPFFLHGGTAYARGRGEQLERLQVDPGGRLLLVLPDVGVSTADAYAGLGMTADSSREPVGSKRAQALLAAGPEASAGSLDNDFEPVVFSRHPILSSIRDAILETGAGWARLCGSGSTLVGWYDDEKAHDRAIDTLSGDHRVMAARPVTGQR